jgi:hypothetical protein
MRTRLNIRRSFAGLAVIVAVILPASAEARFNLEPSGSGPSAPAPSRPVPVTPPPTAADPGFQWGDAGIGAAGAVLVLGSGALVYAAPRRSRRGARAV